MSPEQAQGLPLDARSDVFSFGAVLYEMASGQRAFGGDTTAEVLSAVLRDDPPRCRPSRRSRASSPMRRETAVAAVSVDVRRAARPASGLDESRERSAVDRGPAVREHERGSRERVFQRRPRRRDHQRAPKIDGLHVAARTSSFSFKGKSGEIGDVARRLKVRHVLEGSVRKAGARVRVTAQLVDAANGYQLWSERYDRQLEDIFDVQDEIARSIVDRLKVEFGPAASGSSRSPRTTSMRISTT